MPFGGSGPAPMGFAGPLYAQVATMLRDKISSSEWNSSTPIPNEVELARTIGVSIGTMRKALEMLEEERLIHRHQGRGTFVFEISDDSELERFSNIESNGGKLKALTSSRLTYRGSADAEEASKLGLYPGDAVIRIETLWSNSAGFRAHERISVSETRFRGLDTHTLPDAQLLFAHYRRVFKIAVTSATESVSCLLTTDELASLLSVDKGQAVLRIDRLARDYSRQVIEWSRRYVHLADARYCISMK